MYQRINLRVRALPNITIKGLNRVEEAVSWYESIFDWTLLIERIQSVILLFVFLKLG